MTANGKKSIVILALAIVAVAATFLICGRVERKFAAGRAELELQLRRLPVFVPEVERERLRRELGLTAAELTAPHPAAAELQRRIEQDLEQAVEARFPKGTYANALRRKQRELTAAKVGEKVKFTYHVTEDSVIEITGVYQMKEKGPHGFTVVVDGKFYRLRRIAPEYRHLFDESYSIRQLADLSRSLKAEFEQRRSKFVAARRSELEQRLFRQAGYLQTADGRWLTPDALVAQLLEQRRSAVTADRERRLKELLAAHTFLGLAMFDLRRENL